TSTSSTTKASRCSSPATSIRPGGGGPSPPAATARSPPSRATSSPRAASSSAPPSRPWTRCGSTSTSATPSPSRSWTASTARAREDWRVHLMDTGDATNTGGRVLRLAELLGGETFMLTYGDGVSDVDLDALLRFHRAHGKAATLTAVRPPSRFGGLELDGET